MKWHPPLLFSTPTPPSLEDLETRILEQEHRPLMAYRHLFDQWNLYPKGHPRRKSLLIAVIYCTLFSTTAVAAAGTVVGLATIGLLIWQNQLAIKANSLVQEQLAVQRQQFEALESVKRADTAHEWLKTVYSDTHPTLRENALTNYASYQKSLPPWYGAVKRPAFLKNADLRMISIEGVSNVRFYDCGFDGNLINFIEDCRFWGPLPNVHLAGNIVNCGFYGVRFQNTKMEASFSGCEFSNCDFLSTKILPTTVFENCRFLSIDFQKFEALMGATFKGNLTLHNVPDASSHAERIRAKFPKVVIMIEDF